MATLLRDGFVLDSLDQRRRAHLEMAAAIVLRLGSLLDAGALLDELARLIPDNYAFDRVHVSLWSHSKGHLVWATADSASAEEVDVPLVEAGQLADTMARDEPILLPDARALLPIHRCGQVIGVLELHARPGALQPDEEMIGLQWIADQVGASLHNCGLYAEAVKARSVAEAADRVKSRLVANVTHELRAPLNVILGYSQAALAEPNPYAIDLPASLRHDLGHIYTSGDHLMRLINDLLDLSRAEVEALDLFPETIAPQELLEEVFTGAASHADPHAGVSWRLDLAPSLPVIRADRVRLRQVLHNLLSNASASTPTGEIVLGAEVESAHLHIWVRDTGEGIPPEQQARIFEPFVSGERSDRRSKGVGLGLTITRRLVALHGGTLVLESEQRRGSTFHVRLPLPEAQDGVSGHIRVLTKPAARQAVLGAIEALQPAEHAGEVLIVDDDPGAREFYTRLVSQALPTCAVRTANNGADALLILDSVCDPPTLVILDVVMPEVDGFAVLERLRADRRTRHVPVLVVSGQLLSIEDVRRLDHARVLYQTKDLLSPSEAQAVLQGAATGIRLLPQPTSALVKHALAYVHQHYGRTLDRSEIAQAIGVSESYLSQIFHRELGLSPWEYLTRLRIHSAKELLSNTRESITAVAGSVGFEDPAYFSRVFHKVVGKSPHDFRQRSQ